MSSKKYYISQRGGTSELLLNQIVQELLKIQFLNTQLHWRTTSFALHKATDGFGDEISSLTDKFLEVFMGKYQIRPKVLSLRLSPDVFDGDNYITAYREFQGFLTSLELTDTSLSNIRDEILGEVNKLFYLFTLH